MKPEAKRRVTRLALAVLGAAVVVAAYLRGDYLLGWDCGLVYAGIAAGLLSLLARSLVLTERPSPLRAAAIAALSLPLAYALAYPASINPGVQHFIDKQATDRAARAELAAVFASDPAYRDLSVSTVHVKVVNVTIRGSLPSRSDLDRLRGRIAGECPALDLCMLHWNITLRESAERIEGLDRELFRPDRGDNHPDLPLPSQGRGPGG